MLNRVERIPALPAFDGSQDFYMPVNTIRVIVTEADTRPLELFDALFTLGWGVIFALSKAGYNLKTWAGALTTPVFGIQLWCLLFVVGGSLQIVSLLPPRYPKWRKFSSSVVCGLWAGCAVTFVSQAGLTAVGFVSVSFALMSAWIFAHRATAI